MCLDEKASAAFISQIKISTAAEASLSQDSWVSRSYLILFHPIFLEKSYFVLFFGKCPILSYILAILPLILVFCSLFLSPLFHMRTFLNKNLASLCSASKYFISILSCLTIFFITMKKLDVNVQTHYNNPNE